MHSRTESVVFVYSDLFLSKARINYGLQLLQLFFACVTSHDCIAKCWEQIFQHAILKSQYKNPAGFPIIMFRNICPSCCCYIKLSVFLSDRDLDYRQLSTDRLSSELQLSYISIMVPLPTFPYFERINGKWTVLLQYLSSLLNTQSILLYMSH